MKEYEFRIEDGLNRFNIEYKLYLDQKELLYFYVILIKLMK